MKFEIGQTFRTSHVAYLINGTIVCAGTNVTVETTNDFNTQVSYVVRGEKCHALVPTGELAIAKS